MARRRGGELGLLTLGLVVGIPITIGQKILEGDPMTIAVVGGAAAAFIGWKIMSMRKGARLAEEAQKQASSIVKEHNKQLARLYRQKVYKGEYGEIRFDAFDKELGYFFSNILLPKMNTPDETLKLPELYQYVAAAVYSAVENAPPEGVSLDAIPSDPLEFEHWIADVLRQNGWDAQATQGSGDQGSDVVANFHDHKCIIQCKLYKSAVGNKAVQEVDAARNFFDGDSAVVVGKSGYTRSAKQLAPKNEVLLNDVSDLPNLSRLLDLQ